LLQYIESRRHAQDDYELDSVASEDDFGEDWLRRHRELVRQAAQAAENVVYAEKELQDANRRDHEHILDDEPRVETRANLYGGKTRLEDAAMPLQDFEALLPSRKRKQIDAWLDTGDETASNYKAKRRKSYPYVLLSLPASSKSGDSRVELAVGNQRRMIDEYNWQVTHIYVESSDTSVDST
jgi:hypothetical protein